MKKIFFILLTLFTVSAQAEEVFKCQLKSGKTVYQSTPCKSSVKQKAIEIQKINPRKVAEEEAKLKAWEKDFAKRETERLKAEKEHQAELDRKASVEALKRSAEYEKQQAIEAKRQADALERQNMPPAYPQYLFPPYSPAYPSVPFRQSYPVYPPVVPPHQHFIKERTIPNIPQTQQTEISPDKNRFATPPPQKFIFKSREVP
jgi:Skp family chaperone for outer membrane proteins